MTNQNGYEAVLELVREDPHWLPIVSAALEEARTIGGNRFAGTWVLERAKKHGVTWIPNLKKLVARGILQKEGESTRGGRRAYYSMPDIAGVERAMREIIDHPATALYPHHEISSAGVALKQTVRIPYYANLASCGTPNMSEAHIDDYVEVDTRLAKPGHSYFLVRAGGDSMDLAGIKSGDLVLVRVQNHADVGQKVVVCIDGGTTIKELQHYGAHLVLLPRSSNPDYKPIVLANDALIQGVVVSTFPNFIDSNA